MEKHMIMDLLKLQPSQLYINSDKLESINKWFDPFETSSYDAIPVKELNGKIVFVDGHTRAFAAYLKGADKLKVYWEYEDLSWDAYRVCVNWCIDEGINSIADLRERVVSAESYKELWIGRCQKMHRDMGL